MITVNELKKKYPDPKTSRRFGYFGDYCVGGALCLEFDNIAGYLGESIYFPDVDDLSNVLMNINSNLSYNQAIGFSHEIINANDEKLFEEAWDELNKALNWRK